MKVTNTLAYYGTEKITTVSMFYSTCIVVNFVIVLLLVGEGQSNCVVPCNHKTYQITPPPSGGGGEGLETEKYTI
jgi:hypothetical protein